MQIHVIYIGDFLFGDLYQIRQIAKLKTLSKFPAIRYMYMYASPISSSSPQPPFPRKLKGTTPAFCPKHVTNYCCPYCR